MLKQVDPTEKFVEYWVYQDPTSSVINGADGDISVAKNNPEFRKLKCVVVCENQDDHIVKDMPNHFLVKGFIFTDDETYPDLTDYLGKTERHL